MHVNNTKPSVAAYLPRLLFAGGRTVPIALGIIAAIAGWVYYYYYQGALSYSCLITGGGIALIAKPVFDWKRKKTRKLQVYVNELNNAKLQVAFKDEFLVFIKSSRADFKKIENESEVSWLCWAIKQKCINTARMMIVRGAHIDRQDAQGRTPLDCAYAIKNDYLIKLLSNKGAQASVRTDAIASQKTDTDAIASQKPDLDRQGLSQAMNICEIWFQILHTLKKGSTTDLQKIAKTYGIQGSLLCWAIRKRLVYLALEMIRGGVNIEERDEQGISAYAWAFVHKDIPLIELIQELRKQSISID